MTSYAERVRKGAVAAALVALAACASGDESSDRHSREIPPIEESPVWVLTEDSGWECVPGGTDRSVCDGAVPPGPVEVTQ